MGEEGRTEGGWVLGSARYPRRSAGMTDLWGASVTELWRRGVAELIRRGVVDLDWGGAGGGLPLRPAAEQLYQHRNQRPEHCQQGCEDQPQRPREDGEAAIHALLQRLEVPHEL